jgi:5-formyltetrahydrofolate cyclo-ligase
MTVAAAKTECRRKIRAWLKTVPPAERACAAAAVCQQIQSTDLWSSAKAVLLFSPLPDEVDIWPLAVLALAQGKTVCLPRFNAATGQYGAAQILELDRDLVLGEFAIREPAGHCAEVSPKQIDLALVPGLAFDAKGGRLGRGRGFYDRLLAGFAGVKCGVKCGVCLAGQWVAEIPVAEHDIRMDCVFTEQGAIWRSLS